jgi:hypothetical protein
VIDAIRLEESARICHFASLRSCVVFGYAREPSVSLSSLVCLDAICLPLLRV